MVRLEAKNPRGYTITFLDRPKSESGKAFNENGEAPDKGSLHPLLIGRTENEAIAEFHRYREANPNDRLEMRENFSDRLVISTDQIREQGRSNTSSLSRQKENV